MERLLYMRNKRKNRQVALVVTALVAISQFVALPAGINFVIPGINKPLLAFLSSFGLLWVAYGLWKFKFGG